MLDAVWRSIRGNARTRYARQLFPGIRFGALSYATPDCCLERPARLWERVELNNANLGRHSYIGSDSFVAFATIGRFCSIGNQVLIGTWGHPTHLVSSYPGFYSKNKHTINFRVDEDVEEVLPVHIGSDVWIGHRAILMGGITVGHGAVIGAGAVITKDVEPYSVVAGVPARLLRKRFNQAIVDRLLDLRWWDHDDKTIGRYAHLFGDPEAFVNGFGKVADDVQPQPQRLPFAPLVAARPWAADDG